MCTTPGGSDWGPGGRGPSSMPRKSDLSAESGIKSLWGGGVEGHKRLPAAVSTPPPPGRRAAPPWLEARLVLGAHLGPEPRPQPNPRSGRPCAPPTPSGPPSPKCSRMGFEGKKPRFGFQNGLPMLRRGLKNLHSRYGWQVGHHHMHTSHLFIG